MSDGRSEPSDRSGALARRADRISALVWIGIGAAVLHQARNLVYMSEFGPGPGFFPIWLGISVIFLGLVLLGQTVFRRGSEDELELPRGRAARQMVLVLVAFFTFVFLLEKVGFLICLGLLFSFLLWAVESRGWRFSVAAGLLAALGFWAIFELALQTRLPPGLLGLL